MDTDAVLPPHPRRGIPKSWQGCANRDAELSLVLDIIRSLYAHAEKVGNGLTIYLNIRSYPAVLIFTAYGLGLTRAGRWSALHNLFDFVIERQHTEPMRAVEALFLWWKGAENDACKQIEGLEQRKTPLSDHLFALLSGWGKRFAGLTPDFELMFDRFEMLGSLAHFEQNDKAEVQQQLAGDARNGWAWMPVGRAGWHTSDGNKLVAEIEGAPMKAALTQAGFAKGDSELIDLFIQNFRRLAGRMRW